MYLFLSLLTLAAVIVLIIAGILLARRPSSLVAAQTEQITALLPLLDCGVCGFATCREFARAVIAGTVQADRCFPAGPKNAHAISDILKITLDIPEPVMAVVHCKGGVNEGADRSTYEGMQDCLAADLCGNGPRQCRYGCLGLGTCVRTCPFGAITVNANKVAVIDPSKCNGCGVCVASCPRQLISLIPTLHKIFLACSNHDDGSSVHRYCTAGCTGCALCTRAAFTGSIYMERNLPILDYTAGDIFIAAANRCPSKCFTDLMKARPKANIDIKCDGCGDCVSVCPVNAITGLHDQRHVVDKSLCIGCGQCVGVCHVRSISMWGGLGNIRKESIRTPR